MHEDLQRRTFLGSQLFSIQRLSFIFLSSREESSFQGPVFGLHGWHSHESVRVQYANYAWEQASCLGGSSGEELMNG